MTAPSHGIISQVESTLCALETVLTETELETHLRRFCHEFGFEYFSYIVVNRMEMGGKSVPKPMLATNYPDAWRTRYDKRNYHQLDPVVTAGARSRAPFFWGSAEYLRQLPSLPRRLFDEAGDFGIRSGFTVVVHGPGEYGLMAIASSDSFEKFQGVALEGHIPLQIVSSKVHAIAVERFVARSASTETPLTEQERFCLSWTMRGKTAWEISQILNRSRPTVDFHLQKAMRKLGASNKFHAAFKALQAGLI
jgi:LuxR family transcriptional regulator, activator of conjugal transfer of Ti plasmids